MQCKNEPTFEIYGQKISNLLSSVKLIKNHEFSMGKKLLDTCVTGFLLGLSFLLIISETVDIKNSYDLPTLAAHVNPICFHLVGAIKWICGIRRIDIGDDLIRRMKRCHQLSLRLNENDGATGHCRYNGKIMKYKKQMTAFAVAWLIMSICGVIQWCMNPVIYDFYNSIINGNKMNSTMRHLPYPGTFPWEIDNIFKYIGTFAFQLTAGIGCAVGHAVYETLTITLLASACLQLDHLSDSLMDDVDNALIFKNQFGVWKFEKKLRVCVIHHREILRFIEELINTSSWPLFIVCLDCTMALCLVSLEAATIKIDSSIECIMRVISLMEYWTAINLDLFVYCYFSTRIEELGLKVADAVYTCDWQRSINMTIDEFEEEHRRLRRKIMQMVQLCLMRAQKSIVITGGLFYVLSLPTFKALVGFAISNALILRQVSEEI